MTTLSIADVKAAHIQNSRRDINSSAAHKFIDHRFEPTQIITPAVPLWLYVASFNVDDETEDERAFFYDDYAPVIALGQEGLSRVKPLMMHPYHHTPVWLNPKRFPYVDNIAKIPFDEGICRCIEWAVLLDKEPACGIETVNEIISEFIPIKNLEYDGRTKSAWLGIT